LNTSIWLQKDKSCHIKGPPKDYANGGDKMESVVLKSVTPTAIYTPIVLIHCKDQPADSYCHVVNAPKAKRQLDEVFVRVKVVNSRPKEMYVAVIICALLGPIMLIAFLIYERGVLAKQA
jgi:hypothetical protein